MRASYGKQRWESCKNMSTQPGILDSALLDIGNSSISFFLFVDDEDTLTQLLMGNQTCQLEMGQMSEI